MKGMDFKRYFDCGKRLGLEPYQIQYSLMEETSVLVQNDGVKSQQIGITQNLSGKAIHDGRLGSFGTDRLERKTPLMMAENLLEASRFGKEGNPSMFLSKKSRYHRSTTALSDFVPSDLDTLARLALEIASETKAKESRVTLVEVSLTQTIGTSRFANSYGIRAKQEFKAFFGDVAVICKDESGKTRTGSKSFVSFRNANELLKKSRTAADKALKAACDFFKATPCPSGDYPVVLSSRCFASLLSFFLGHLSAKKVQENLSLFAGKIGQKVVSDKISLVNDPHSLSLGSANYDSDGVPTQSFKIIEKGILRNFFYSLESAAKDGVESNGCASGGGNGYPQVVRMRPGKLSLDGLLGKMGEGIYITDIRGLESGVDDQALHFSLPCEGYLIKGGKIARPVGMITVSGNVKDMMEDILDIASDVSPDSGASIDTPSVLVRSLSIAG